MIYQKLLFNCPVLINGKFVRLNSLHLKKKKITMLRCVCVSNQHKPRRILNLQTVKFEIFFIFKTPFLRIYKAKFILASILIKFTFLSFLMDGEGFLALQRFSNFCHKYFKVFYFYKEQLAKNVLHCYLMRTLRTF